MKGEKLLRVGVVAQRLGLSERQVRNLIYQGKLSAIYQSERKLRISEAAVQSYQNQSL